MVKKMINKVRGIPITVKASVSYTVCSILQKCLSFITLPLFTRLLTTEEYGQYSIYSSWSGILAIFITLNLPYGSFSKALIKYEDRRDVYIASCQTICVVLAAIFFLLYFPFNQYWNKLFELPTLLIVIMVIELLMHTAVLFWNGRKRFEYKYKSVIGLTLLSSFTSPVLAYILVKNLDEKGYARIIGYATVAIVIGGFFFIFNYIRSKKLFDKEMIRFALSFNLPLIVYYLSQIVFNQSDRIMISHLSGTDKAGIYGVAYSLSMILNFVLNAINGSYLPWFYERIKNGEVYKNKKISFMISIIMSVMLMVVIWVAPEIIQVMAGEKYMSAIWIVPPVTMSNLLLLYVQFCINVEFYYEERKLLVYSSVLSAMLNIGLNWIFIPIFGFIVAGYTTLLSYVVFVLCNYISFKSVIKKYKLKDEFYNVKLLLIELLVFAILTAIAMLLYNLTVIRLSIIFIAMIVAVIFRKKIISYVKQIFTLKKSK